MKVDLSTAKMTAAILVLASSALAGTNAMGAPSSVPPASAVHVPQASPTPIKSFKLKCGGYGDKEVIILNAGDAPVPAGTVVEWQIPKTSPGEQFPEGPNNGVYTFKLPLAHLGQIRLNEPPPPPRGGAQGPPMDPSVLPWGFTGFRSCTVTAVDPRTIAPVPMVRH
jgi:hypothetical protein